MKLADGCARASNGRSLTLAELAADGLRVKTAFVNGNRLTYTYGSAAAHVAVDPGTGDVELLDCLAVEDVGRIVNPLTLHGQAIGGMVQGLGGAFLEHLVYDANGQLLSGNLADYLIPTATDFPQIRAIALENHRSPSNPLGCQGRRRGRDHPDRRPDGQRRRQCFGLVRGNAEPAAALARPRLAHGFAPKIHREFGMTVERFGNPHAPTCPTRDKILRCGSSDR
jgi:hypothetical protein